MSDSGSGSTRPLGEQDRPVVAHADGTVIDGHYVRQIILAGFESRAMHKAYERWLDSGDAHAAFGDWADTQGFE